MRTLDYAVTVGLSALLSYWLTTSVMTHAHQSYADGQLGGIWAVIATIFVLRESRDKSLNAALSRMSATLISFALCLTYLAIWHFHVWGFAVLVALSVLIPELIGQPGASVTAAITTTVVMIVAELSPQAAWREPILRLADTAIGVAVGIAAAMLLNEIGKAGLGDRGSQTPPGRPHWDEARLSRKHACSSPYDLSPTPLVRRPRRSAWPARSDPRPSGPARRRVGRRPDTAATPAPSPPPPGPRLSARPARGSRATRR